MAAISFIGYARTVIHRVSVLGTVALRQMLKSVYIRTIQKLNQLWLHPSMERQSNRSIVTLSIAIIGWLGPSLYLDFKPNRISGTVLQESMGQYSSKDLQKERGIPIVSLLWNI